MVKFSLNIYGMVRVNQILSSVISSGSQYNNATVNNVAKRLMNNWNIIDLFNVQTANVPVLGFMCLPQAIRLVSDYLRVLCTTSANNPNTMVTLRPQEMQNQNLSHHRYTNTSIPPTNRGGQPPTNLEIVPLNMITIDMINDKSRFNSKRMELHIKAYNDLMNLSWPCLSKLDDRKRELINFVKAYQRNPNSMNHI